MTPLQMFQKTLLPFSFYKGGAEGQNFSLNRMFYEGGASRVVLKNRPSILKHRVFLIKRHKALSEN